MLPDKDSEVSDAIHREVKRQECSIELIAPKNYSSAATRQAFSSVLTFTSVEGYPGKRYHAGVVNIDDIEMIAINRAKAMLNAGHANVQPHSGTQSNQAVYYALLKPGDTVLSMDLSAGGHLSHGLNSNFSGRYFKTVSYGTLLSGYIDYDELRTRAKANRPRMIIVGGSSYPRAIDFELVSEIAREIGAFLVADVSHFSGLIIGGVYPHPFPHADVITTSTNKNLRGPRGGLIACRDETIGRAIDKAVFPGIQGGPLPEIITAKAVSFGEALTDDFKVYAEGVLRNSRTLSSVLIERGYDVITGGTDTPLVVVDLRRNRVKGSEAQLALEEVGITCNRNLVPADPEGPAVTSGIRMGTSAITTRGLSFIETERIGHLIADTLDTLATPVNVEKRRDRVRAEVANMAASFPIYDPSGLGRYIS